MAHPVHCEHPDFEYAVVVQEIPGQTTTPMRYYFTELSVRCQACQGEFQFDLGAAHPDIAWAAGTLKGGTIARLRASLPAPVLTQQRLWQPVRPRAHDVEPPVTPDYPSEEPEHA